MSVFPQDLRYSQHHVWVKTEGDHAVLIGITDDVQEQIQHIESVDVPQAGDELEIDTACMSFHVRNELYDIISPLTGRVIETNQVLLRNPDEVFVSPYEDGWLFRMEFDEPEELEMLMDSEEYTQFLLD